MPTTYPEFYIPMMYTVSPEFYIPMMYTGWSSPFSISQCKYDSPETGIIGTSESPTTEYSDRNEKCQAIAGSMIAMDTIKASSLLVEHNLGKVERMIISSRKQPNHAGQIITNLLPDDNTQMTSQSSMLWTEKSVKTW
uniref:Ovule protein n=1 Tax=Loa loa TaxID=7209 RepID=A0A1I7W2B2_LOALO